MRSTVNNIVNHSNYIFEPFSDKKMRAMNTRWYIYISARVGTARVLK